MPRAGLGGRWALAVDGRRPVKDAAQMAMMQQAGILPGAAIVFYDINVPPAWPPGTGPRGADTLWLPITPLAEFVFVPTERRPLYLARFVARTRAGGWLIENTARSRTMAASYGWVFRALAHTHRATRRIEVGPWRATWYQYVGD
jgi:hypothetical protein